MKVYFTETTLQYAGHRKHPKNISVFKISVNDAITPAEMNSNDR